MTTESENATMLTILVIAAIIAAGAITWSVTDRAWEREAIASGHAERILVEGSPEFAWK